MEAMDAKKTVSLTMADLKEIDFHLQKAVMELQKQIDSHAFENESLLQEKKAFLEEIIIKLAS